MHDLITMIEADSNCRDQAFHLFLPGSLCYIAFQDTIDSASGATAPGLGLAQLPILRTNHCGSFKTVYDLTDCCRWLRVLVGVLSEFKVWASSIKVIVIIEKHPVSSYLASKILNISDCALHEPRSRHFVCQW